MTMKLDTTESVLMYSAVENQLKQPLLGNFRAVLFLVFAFAPSSPSLRADQPPLKPQETTERVASSTILGVARNGADSDGERWNKLQSLLSDKEHSLPNGKGRSDWASIARLAREFREEHALDAGGKRAHKIELIAYLNLEAGHEQLEPATKKSVDDFIADKSIPAADRFDVSAMTKEWELKSGKGRPAPDPHILRVKHAKDLIKEFPSDKRGYGYLLSIAQSKSSSSATELAQEIIDDVNAPEDIKNSAQRLQAQRRMEGRKLVVNGLDLASFKGRPVLIYSWTVKRPEIFKLIARCAEFKELVIIGINLDDNRAAAEKLVGSLSVPGIQYYEPLGKDGPLASQFHFMMPSSIYLVHVDGVLRDVNGHRDTLSKLARLVENRKGGRHD